MLSRSRTIAVGLINIEHEGLLFRGPDADTPTEVWDYPRGRWAPYHGPAWPPGAARVATEPEAEALKTNNPAAEHYLYYDAPPWRQPLSESYRDSLRSERARRAMKQSQDDSET